MQRRPTLSDVAERAGVSQALVSIVMRGAPGASAATRERVRLAAEEIGYRPDARARMLRSQRTKLLGVVFTAGQDFHAGLVDGVYLAAEARGYEVLLSCVTPHRHEKRAVQTLLDDRCEGLLLIGTGLSHAALSDLDARMPVVTVARRVRGIDSVRSDDRAGAAIAVDHLADLGHGAAVHVDGLRAPGAADRRRGFITAAGRRALAATVLPGGLTEREGAAAATSLLGELPSAVFAFNDRCALGVLDVLIRAGVRVPEEVSVIGFDDSPLAGLAHVDLTTVGQDSAQLAELSVARVVDRLEGVAAGPVDQVCQPRLVARGSTARPR